MKRILFSLFIAFCAFEAAAVTNLVISPSTTAKAYCPGTQISYSVSNSNGPLPNCIFHWTINGGVIVGANAGTQIYVVWNDNTGTGTLTVQQATCSPSNENGISTTATYTRLSVFGLNFPSGVCNDVISIPLCSPGIATICVNRMYIQNTGGAGQPPLKEVDRYIFSIPAGWKSNSTVGPADISTTLNNIPLEPLSNNASGGTVTVVGSVTNSCGGTLNSNQKIITITRSPTVSITAPGYTGARCGLTAPVTFTVTSLACATAYSWRIPPGWTGSSNSNSITVTPNGTNGGTLSVQITLSGGGTVSASYNISYSNVIPAPTLTGGSTYEFCNYETFTLTATVPNGYASNFGFDWYATPVVTINGSSPTQASPLHTTSNAVSVTIPGSNFGPQTIAVRLNNVTCNPSAYATRNKRVGPYSNSEFTIIGPANVCPNQAADFRPSFITPDLTGYQWSAPAGWSNSGQGTPYFSVSVPAPFPGGAITLRLQNRCGWTNTPYVLNLSAGSCFAFSYSPNPVTGTLSITDLDPTQEASATLLDKNNKSYKVEKNMGRAIEMDLSQAPNGLYILVVQQNGKSESQQIIVNH